MGGLEGERRVAVIPDGWYQGRVRRIAWSSPAGASGAPTNKTFYGIVTRVRSLHTPKIRRPFVHREILFLYKHPKPQTTPPVCVLPPCRSLADPSRFTPSGLGLK